MNKLVLLATSALVALGASFPAFADSATTTQTNETNGYANQHQAGFVDGTVLDDTATIVQAGGNGDIATQEQGRLSYIFPTFFDAEVGGVETITQTNNANAVAHQQMNANFDTQNITQTGTIGGTTALQTINTPLGGSNAQTITQSSDNSSSVSQAVGVAAGNMATEASNRQTATQNGQTNSSITQTVDGTSSNNTMIATQNATGASNTQMASIINGSNNYIEQFQDSGDVSNTENASVSASSNDRALQYQAAGVMGGSETIIQSGGMANQAGQGQGTSNNVATITQTGGSGNIAIQNQGLQPGNAGFMFNNGGVVVHN
jgi:hypothetical protein